LMSFKARNKVEDWLPKRDRFSLESIR
jgi:hypothetical protein